MSDSRSKVQEAIELQRGAIAAEIHDTLLPYIFATRMRLEALLSRIEEAAPLAKTQGTVTNHSSGLGADSEGSEACIHDFAPRDLKAAVEMLQDAMMIGRELIGQLYPADMTISWREHLNNAFERLSAHAGSRLVIEGDLEDWVDDPEQRLAARRIAQEAIRNAVRHGKASEIEVVTQPKSQLIQIMIRDNGIGFDPNAGHRGFGLRIMQMRATQVDATISIESQRGGPTAIAVAFKTQEAAAAD
jgi:signal transduction histidine kinase